MHKKVFSLIAVFLLAGQFRAAQGADKIDKTGILSNVVGAIRVFRELFVPRWERDEWASKWGKRCSKDALAKYSLSTLIGTDLGVTVDERGTINVSYKERNVGSFSSVDTMFKKNNKDSYSIVLGERTFTIKKEGVEGFKQFLSEDFVYRNGIAYDKRSITDEQPKNENENFEEISVLSKSVPQQANVFLTNPHCSSADWIRAWYMKMGNIPANGLRIAGLVALGCAAKKAVEKWRARNHDEKANQR